MLVTIVVHLHSYTVTVSKTYIFTAGGVFAAKDGYKLGYYMEGVVNILAWNIECSQQVFHKTITVGDNIIHDDVIQFPCPYDLSNYLISIQVQKYNMFYY